ncbi:C40 family peptidase [Oerskovia paurometabola]|uniref:C40 family peptidase n=1 Tax=Oerskovia paurometabola TaxID=162170 RepID=A0ABW1XGF1_9CELL|nr:C40 family peptidase [Oerskovia paurometabola]MBM7495432.1 cell wall-associated NlpC family hydrolase [Oerskovia paurometabola]
MTSRPRARHRAAHRPITPLTSLGRSAASGANAVVRRSAVVAASSGLLISVFTAPANAAPASDESKSIGSVDLAAVTSQAREALQTSPAITVAADAVLPIEQASVAVTPAPEPEPEPAPAPVAAPAPERSAAASRSVERAQPAAAKAVAAPAASASGSAAVDIALKYVGVPYVYGGSSPSGFDCSGLTQYVYAQLGVSLPHQSGAQRDAGTPVSAAEARPGDLIWTPGHVAIYAGNGMQIEATTPGSTVKHSKIWQNNPTFIRVG